jgi:hypothetical protein
MNFDQKRRFAAQMPTLQRAIIYSTRYQNEQANKKSEPPKKFESPKPPEQSGSEESHSSYRTGRHF